MDNMAVTQDTTGSQEKEKENVRIHYLFQAISVNKPQRASVLSTGNQHGIDYPSIRSTFL